MANIPVMPEGMASRSRTIYIGVTGNLLKRVLAHKWKEHDGFTERYNCDRLVLCGSKIVKMLRRRLRAKSS